MSWDIFVMDLPADAKSINDIPASFTPRTLGKRSQLIEKIQAVLPFADFRNPEWGTIDGDEWSIEVSMGAEEECDSFALHIRGGDGAAGAVEAILAHLGLRALDAGAGDFFVGGPGARESFRKWRAYRDQVCGE